MESSTEYVANGLTTSTEVPPERPLLLPRHPLHELGLSRFVPLKNGDFAEWPSEPVEAKARHGGWNAVRPVIPTVFNGQAIWSQYGADEILVDVLPLADLQ